MKLVVRDSLVRVAFAAIAYTVAELTFDVVAQMIPAALVQMFSLVSLGATVVLTIALILSEVRAYRSVVAAYEGSLEFADKALFVSALWFGAGLPMAMVSLARCSIWRCGSDGTTILLAQVGIALVLGVLSCIKLREVSKS